MKLTYRQRLAREILIRVARDEENTTIPGQIGYKELSERVLDSEWFFYKIGRILDLITPISGYELMHGRPPLSELVVNLKSKEPRQDFNNIKDYWKEEYGVKVPYRSHNGAQKACREYWSENEDPDKPLKNYAVITVNDESQLDDATGELYHFPKRYLSYLPPGTKVIYYKGKLKNRHYRDSRLSDMPHYFGVAVIDFVFPDLDSDKGDYYASLTKYRAFRSAVPFKQDNEYLEEIPANRKSNYWRDGVRPITQDIYRRIKIGVTLEKKKKTSVDPDLPNLPDLESGTEGTKKFTYNARYERDSKLRSQAIQIHGLDCFGCGFNFEQTYGEYAKGYIQVHHAHPVSKMGGKATVNPATDLIPLCANCHAIVHRRLDETVKH